MLPMLATNARLDVVGILRQIDEIGRIIRFGLILAIAFASTVDERWTMVKFNVLASEQVLEKPFKARGIRANIF